MGRRYLPAANFWPWNDWTSHHDCTEGYLDLYTSIVSCFIMVCRGYSTNVGPQPANAIYMSQLTKYLQYITARKLLEFNKIEIAGHCSSG